jgi:hypothetical protein
MPMRETNARRRKLAAAAIAAAISVVASPAPAQTLLDAILGIFGRPPPPASPIRQPPPDLAPKQQPPRVVITPRWSSSPSRGTVGYCVRLCDGRYFPLPRLQSNAASEKVCKAMCPQSRAMVFWGGSIDGARASNGWRYADLEVAFSYRNKVVPNCTCNGTDVYGTAAISLRADITLRRGDVVVTDDGVKVFVGSIGDAHEDDDFVPVQVYRGLSANQRRVYSDIVVTRQARRKSPVLDFNTRFVLDATTPPRNSMFPENQPDGR